MAGNIAAPANFSSIEMAAQRILQKLLSADSGDNRNRHLSVSEFHGVVRTGGLPVPGVSVTAIQGDRKIATPPKTRDSSRLPISRIGTPNRDGWIRKADA